MAIPATADRLLQALLDEGVKVVQDPGWRTRNRNHKGAFGPVHGVMLHHTVTGPKVDAVPICRDGYAELPGPLCHGVIKRDGTVVLIGHGRANHAGGGDPRVLAAVKDENYGQRPPAPLFGNGDPGTADGNRYFYGFECENLGNGVDPWPAVQVEAMVRASAALARLHGWTDKSVIGHKEWSDQKNDPHGPVGVKGSDSVAMPDLRRRIGERLNHEPSWVKGSTPTTPTTPGGPMAANLSHLYRAEGDNLLPSSAQRIYWTVEHADEPNQHGAGGFSVLSNADWSATLHLHVSGLLATEELQVRHIETDTAGVATSGPAAHLPGRPSGGSVTRAFHLQGSMRGGDVLSFEVTNLGGGNVTLHDARLILLSWPL